MSRGHCVGRPGERGLVAGAEALLFGTLILLSGTLLLTAAWGVLQARSALDHGAREYLRAYTEADDPSEAVVSGRAALRTALDGAGIDPDEVEIREPDAAAFGPCADASVTVSAVRPGVRLPFVGEFGAVTISSRHDELVDPLREMTPGRRHDPEDTPCAR